MAIAVTLLAGSISAGHAQDLAFDERQKGSIEQIVKDYLLRNPEVVQDAIEELERRQQVAQRAASALALKEERASLTSSPHDVVIGNPSGDVTLVEFFDYNCGYCKRAKGDVDALIKADPQLRVVLKEYPVLGPESAEASRLAVAAKAQLSPEQARTFHNRLMETSGRVNGERVLAVARELGLDLERLRREAQQPSIGNVLQENARLGERLGITGTPAFVLEQDIITGAVGFEPLRQAVANTRRCGKAVC